MSKEKERALKIRYDMEIQEAKCKGVGRERQRLIRLTKEEKEKSQIEKRKSASGNWRRGNRTTLETNGGKKVKGARDQILKDAEEAEEKAQMEKDAD